jgi:hypothetical protein
MATQSLDPAQRELGQRPHIEVHHLGLFGAVEIGRKANQSESRIVDDVGGFDAERGEFSRDARWPIPLSEIGGNHERARLAGRCDLAGDGVQLCFVACDEDQLVAVGGEDAG